MKLMAQNDGPEINDVQKQNCALNDALLNRALKPKGYIDLLGKYLRVLAAFSGTLTRHLQSTCMAEYLHSTCMAP